MIERLLQTLARGCEIGVLLGVACSKIATVVDCGTPTLLPSRIDGVVSRNR